MAYAFSTLANLVNSEIGQALSVGHKVGRYRRRLTRLADAKAKPNPRALARLYEDVKALGLPKNFPYEEPSELSAIRGLRPRARRTYEVRLSQPRLQDRILGA